MGSDELSCCKCGNSARLKLVCPAVWAQEFPSFLCTGVHGCELLLRGGVFAGGDFAGAGAAGGGRRGAAAVVAIDPAGELSGKAALSGHGSVRTGVPGVADRPKKTAHGGVHWVRSLLADLRNGEPRYRPENTAGADSAHGFRVE